MRSEASLEGGKVLSEDLFSNNFKNKEAFATSDVSCDGEHVKGVWMIEDNHITP